MPEYQDWDEFEAENAKRDSWKKFVKLREEREKAGKDAKHPPIGVERHVIKAPGHLETYRALSKEVKRTSVTLVWFLFGMIVGVTLIAIILAAQAFNGR